MGSHGLTPDGMGGMKEAGYRSAMQYLDLAKQEHIGRGHSWTEQHRLAYRVCARSCRRGLGPAKQAAALPLGDLAKVPEELCRVTSGPRYPVKATVVASWWILREIEASRARVRHVRLDFSTRTASWLLPSSKTDVAALGATRKHSCSCSVLPPEICPFHCLAALVGAKAGWADTFQKIAAHLQIPLCLQNGARAFTGHSARATGAQFQASRGIELWRIQIFGRWGSDVILRYIRDAPLASLAELALESGHAEDIRRIRHELDALLHHSRHVLAIPEASWRDEVPCMPAKGPVLSRSRHHLVLNTAIGGKLHRCLTDLSVARNALNPNGWRACCLWPFASGDAQFKWVSTGHKGRKCKHCFPEQRKAPSGSSRSTSSSGSSSDSSSSDSS